MFGKIYLLTNTVNGKIYVGQTTSDVDTYISRVLHKKKFNNARLLDRAIQKYGPGAWSHIVLAEADSRKELDELEVKFISALSARDMSIGYNICKGGERGPGWPKGNKNGALFSNELKSQIAKNVSAALKGRKFSDSHKRALSESRLGVKNHMTGRTHSDETKMKMRNAALGRKLVNNKWTK